MKVIFAALCLVVAIGCVWGQGYPGQAPPGGVTDIAAGGPGAIQAALAAARGRSAGGGMGGNPLGALLLMGGDFGSDRMRMFFFCQQNIFMCMMAQDFV